MDEEGVDVLDFFIIEQGSCPHFMDDLPENLEPGTVIKIKGLVLPICSRYVNINYLYNLVRRLVIFCQIGI